MLPVLFIFAVTDRAGAVYVVVACVFAVGSGAVHICRCCEVMITRNTSQRLLILNPLVGIHGPYP